MDKGEYKSLLDGALAAAGQHGLHIEIVKLEPKERTVQADAVLRLHYGRQKISYAAEIKRGVQRTTLGAVIHQLARLDQPAMLIADYLTPPLAETLKEHGIAFIDGAGNAYLNHPPLFVWVKGQTRKKRDHPGSATTRAFSAGGLQVILPLLYRPEWADRSYRELAKLADVAHGTVGVVLGELSRLGFMAKVGGKRRLLQPERLLQQWTEAYARTLRPKLLLGRFRADQLDWHQTLDPGKHGYVYGGEAAAARLTGQLRPGTVALYGKKLEPRLILDQRLRPDPVGNVEILKRFWDFDEDRSSMAPLPLVYADLLAIGDARCLETAKLIYGDIIARFGR